MSRMRSLALGLLAMAFTACGSSPPTRYYTLSEIAPSASASSQNAGVVPLRVEPVSIPPELDRLELVSHSGPNRVHIADSDRWAAPLDEQIRRVLSDDLAARLAAGTVADPNEPNTRDPRRSLSVSIAVFEADASCAVTLNASWTLHATHSGSESGVERIQQASGGTCPAALPAAMSHAIATLADRLSAIVAR
jgi:uncharacterized protein